MNQERESNKGRIKRKDEYVKLLLKQGRIAFTP
jgi:hypothetical protein